MAKVRFYLFKKLNYLILILILDKVFKSSDLNQDLKKEIQELTLKGKFY